MTKQKMNKRTVYTATVVTLAAVLCLSVVLGALASFGLFNANAETTPNARVTMLDLMNRYPVDYVVGPVDVVDVWGPTTDENGNIIPDGEITRKDMDDTGHYTYKNGNYERDSLGNPVVHTCTVPNCGHQVEQVQVDGKTVEYVLTNNKYGIAAEKYFNVESYIFTKEDTQHQINGTKTNGRILYGWEPDIQACVREFDITDSKYSGRSEKLAENGEKLVDGKLAPEKQPIGIYVTYTRVSQEEATKQGYKDRMQDFSTTEKYALIVPDDITSVGQGSAAFVVGKKAYYADTSTTSTSVSVSSTDVLTQFTDFASFITERSSPYTVHPSTSTHYWTPRERLAGVFFDEGSNLQKIEGGSSDAATAEVKSNRTMTADKGKAAFQGCDNLRFMILPKSYTNSDKSIQTTGITTIGAYAFYRCTQLVDVNIPNSVTTIGTSAFGSCEGLLHISIPSSINNSTATNAATDAFDGCKKLENVDNAATKYNPSSLQNKNNTIFVMANRPQNGVLDTGAFMFLKSSSALSAIALAGETGEDPNKVFVFPQAADFTDASNRREKVEYDYLDCNGNKIKISLENVTYTKDKDSGEAVVNVTQYDIAANFAASTWCRNVVMPKEIKTVGASAFENSHTSYIETYATTFGEKAFADNGVAKSEQWIYIHRVPTNGKFDTAFTADDNSFSKNGTKNIVFASEELYKAFKTAPAALHAAKTYYQIPVYAHVENLDNDTLTFLQGDMMANFYNDYGYNANLQFEPNSDSTTGLIYAKKLNSYRFDYVKTSIGEWQQDADSDDALWRAQSNPTLSNMTNTVWYTAADYKTKTTAGSASTTVSAPIHIYTKNIAKPKNIKDGDYQKAFTYGSKYTVGGSEVVLGQNDTQDIAFLDVLGLDAADYRIGKAEFKYPDNTSGADPTSILHAGTYVLTIQPSAKYGTWSADYMALEANAGYFTATITVARKSIDFSSLGSVPSFANISNDGKYTLHGSATPLFQYNDGWYIAQKYNETLNDDKTVTNSYAYYTGNPVGIMIQGETNFAYADDDKEKVEPISSTLGDYLITSRNGTRFSGSSAYTATFTFQVKYITGVSSIQSDYYFNYGGNNLTSSSDAMGLTMTNKQEFSFTLTKRWYIVIESNMFVEKGQNNQVAYTPLDSSTVTYRSDDINVKVPELYKRDDSSTIKYDITYTAANGQTSVLTTGENNRELLSEQPLSHYINKSMPVGTYVLKLYGSEVKDYEESDGTVKTYNEIIGEYTIKVDAKDFDNSLVSSLHKAISADEKGNSSPLTEKNKKLHGDISTELKAINLVLANEAETDAATGRVGYWAADSCKGYYDTAVTLLYNVDGSGSSLYVNEMTALGSVTIANFYKIYYSLSAKNYASRGGENAADREDLSFRTTFYTDMSLAELYKQIVQYGYFKDVVYTGAEVRTTAPSSEHYEVVYVEGQDYVNAHENAYVQLKLYRKELARWNVALDGNGVLTDDEIALAKEKLKLDDEDPSILNVYFDIVPAVNSWQSAPQMPGWQYDGFDKNVHTIVGTLTFPNAEVYYRIGTKNNDGTYTWIDMEGTLTVDGKTDSTFFTYAIDNDGNVTLDQSVRDKLNGLSVNTYYLGSYVVAHSDGNVSAFLTPETQYGRVVLNKATNSWTTTPSMTSWQYKGFDSTANFTAGELKHTVDGIDIAYKVEGNGQSIELQFNQDGTLDADTVSALNNLTVLQSGLYTLIAIYPENGNVTTPEYKSSFTVSKATNSWTTAPGLTGWRYQLFKTDNFRAGVPALTGDITYTVIKPDNTRFNLTFKQDGTLDNDTVNALNALPAENYRLAVSVTGDGTNYDDWKPQDIEFTVSLVANSWQTSPGLSAWKYAGFSASNFVLGQAKYGTVGANNSHQVEYTLMCESDSSVEVTFAIVYDAENEVWNLSADTVAALQALMPNVYTLKAHLAQSVNYDELDYTTTVTVSKADNVWAEGKTPGMTSWQYKGFGASVNFTAGEPVSKTVVNGVESVVSYTVGGNGITPIVFTNINDAAEQLKSLEVKASAYTLSVSYAGDDRYENLVYTTTFTVIQADNRWATTPAFASWTYGQFSESNLRLGEAAFNEGGDTVTYTIQAVNVSDDNPFESFALTFGEDGKLSSDSIAKLTSLVVRNVNGGYQMVVAHTTQSANYKNVEPLTIPFSVLAASNNAWSSNSNVTNWTYGQFDASMITSSTATFGDDKTDVLYTIQKNGAAVQGFENLTFDALKTALSDNPLGAGNYNLYVATAASDNYNTAVQNVPFEVAKAPNSWTENKRPSIASEWTCGSLDPLGENEHYYTPGEAKYECEYEYIYYPAMRNSSGNWVANIQPVTRAAGEIGDNRIDEKDLSTLPAGTYALVAVCKETDNYLSAQEVLIFTINLAENDWATDCAPEGTLTWEWGKHESALDNTGLMAAAPANGDASATYSIYIVKDGSVINTVVVDGKAVSITADTLMSYLAVRGVGSYEITTMVDPTDYYKGVSKITYLTVTEAAFDWTTAPSSSSWTWGNEAQKSFAQPVVKTVKTDDVYTVTYTLSVKGSATTMATFSSDDGKTPFEQLQAALFGLDANTYAVTVAVSGANYFTLTESVDVTVTKAALDWTAYGDTSWDWDNTSNENKTLNMPTATTYGQDVTLTYTVAKIVNGVENAVSKPADKTWEQYLMGADVGVYTVTATATDNNVSDANYSNISVTFTVTINKAQNPWTTAPQTVLTKVFDAIIDGFVEPQIKFGEIEYYLKNGDTESQITFSNNESGIRAWINNQKTQTDTPIIIVVKVIAKDGEAGNYKLPASVEVQLTVTGKISHWDSEYTWRSNVYTVYGGGQMNVFWENLGLPYYNVLNDKWEKRSTLTYTLEFTSADGSFKTENLIDNRNFYDLNEIRHYLVDDTHFMEKDESGAVGYRAGTYTITAMYVPGDTNYTTLVETITIVVDKATPVWDESTTLASEYRKEYQTFVLENEPKATFTCQYGDQTVIGEAIVTIKVINREDENVIERPETYNSFSEWLYNLYVGDYIVEYSVVETNNYNAVAAKTARVIITPAINDWINADELKLTYEFYRYDTQAADEYKLTAEQIAEMYRIKLPTSTRGEVTAVLNGAPDGVVVKDGYLIGLEQLAAATYSLTFEVAAGEHGNYNGLKYDCSVVIKLNENTWNTSPESSYEWKGSADVSKFVQPIAKYHNELLRYDIAKVGDSTYIEKNKGLDQATFIGRLKDLINGSYIVTMRIGSANIATDYNHDDSSTREKVEIYNGNYTELTATTEITITRLPNEWKVPFVGGSWTYGDVIATSDAENAQNATVFTRPQLTEETSNAKIKYTVTDPKNVKTVFDGKQYSEEYRAKSTFDELIAWLGNKGRIVGVYTVTAELDADATAAYEIPLPTTVLYTINKITPAWDQTDKYLEEFESINWVFGDDFADKLPTLTVTGVSNYWTPKIVYSVNNSTLTGTWADYFNETENGQHVHGANVYRIYARIEADDYNEALTFESTVTISRAKNTWADGTNANATLTMYYGSALDEIVYKPTQNNIYNQITVKINNIVTPIKLNDDEIGVDVNTKTFSEYFKSQPVGTYTVTITVAQTDFYSELTASFTLTINKANDNGWKGGVGLSIGNWTWNDSEQPTDWIDHETEQSKLTLTLPVPLYGGQVVITVTKGGNEQFVSTINYKESGAVDGDNYETLLKKLWALDAGTYSIKAQIPETSSYVAYEQAAVTFVIGQATNSWNEKPSITGWSYDQGTVYPSATPKYGNKNDVVFSYAKVPDDSYINSSDGTVKYYIQNSEDTDASKCLNADQRAALTWDDSLPYEAGNYYIRAYLAGNDNYRELYGYSSFPIGAGTNMWVNMPGVIVWNWNEYDINVNQFSASARNKGTVTFTIKKIDKGNYKLLEKSDFKFYASETEISDAQLNLLNNGFSFVTETVDGEVVITKLIAQNVADALNALKPGSYQLTANAAAANNYDSIESSIEFSVGIANNSWTTAPNVSAYDYDGFVAANLTAGVAKYGSAVTYRIGDDGKTITADGLARALEELDAGTYTLNAWVKGDADGYYNDFYSDKSPYTVVFKVSRIQNKWVTGKEPASPTTAGYYTEFVAKDKSGNYTFDFAKWFVEPQAIGNNDSIEYAVYDTTYKVLYDSITYDELFETLRGLGSNSYIIRVKVDGENTNYYDLTSDVSLEILRHENSFKDGFPSIINGQWNQVEDVNGAMKNASTVNYDFNIEANCGNETMTFTIKGANNVNVECHDREEFDRAVADLGAGSYQVVITVEQTNDYKGLSRTVQMDIAQATNELNDVAVNNWTWNDKTNPFSANKPLYGNLMYVEILRTDKGDATPSRITVDFANVDSTNAVMAVNAYLNTLGAGEYVITVTANADDNWKAGLSKEFEVTVAKAANTWQENGAPQLSGSTFVYGQPIAPTALPVYGAAKYTYYQLDENGNRAGAGSTTAPTRVGKYAVTFTADASANYLAIEENPAETKTFEIIRKTETGFVVTPGAVGWTWGTYDRTVHVFKGLPNSEGKVTYSIWYNGKVVSVDGKELKAITLVDSDGNSAGDVATELYVSEAVAELIAKLPAATYTLRLDIAETDYCEGFDTSDVTFEVKTASNGWEVTPQIASWTVGGWNKDDNTPLAESRFGTVNITVVSAVNGELFYKTTYDAATKQYAEPEVNRLKNALAGWYTMTAVVEGEEGCYDGINEATIRVQVYMRGSTEVGNSWYESPGIIGWTAISQVSDGNMPNEPFGTPLRGLPYFEFYKAVYNKDGSIKRASNGDPVLGELIGESADSIKIEKGDNKYYKEFYLPMAPGDYVIVACAVNESNGVVVTEDNMRTVVKQVLTIAWRENTFKDDPHIDTLLFLGDRDNWTGPTSSAALEDSYEITYTYETLDGTNLGSTIPTDPGKYRVVAHANAKYSKEITKTAEFEVALSTNEWLTTPSISDWSEEFGNDAPEAIFETMYGGEISYEYRNVETGDIFYERPTEAGTYEMTATIKAEGYRDLVGTATFTIEPAFDSTLVLINTLLGVVGCALAVVVIIFAIRRYKEN